MSKRLAWAVAATLLLVSATAWAVMTYPEDLAKEVPLYPGAEIMQTMSMPQGVVVILTSSDDSETVFAFYQEATAKSGWTVAMEMKQPEHLTLAVTKEERNLMIDVGKDGTQVMISITYTSNN